MASVRTYSGRRLHDQWSRFLRANRRKILVVAALETVLIGAVTALLLRAYGAHPIMTYVLGALHALTVALIYYTLRIGFLTSNRDAVRQVRGNLGELNTRDELKRAKRRRLIWDWIDSITVSTGDIDHLVITRARWDRRDRLQVAQRGGQH